MNKDMCRIVKISKDALYEFLYENFIARQEDMLDVDPSKVANTFAIDWKEALFFVPIPVKMSMKTSSHFRRILI